MIWAGAPVTFPRYYDLSQRNRNIQTGDETLHIRLRQACLGKNYDL